MKPTFVQEIKAEYVGCDLCGSLNHEVLYSKIDHVTNWEFHVVRCDCGMVFVNPMPLKEYLSSLYPDHYLHEKPQLDGLYDKMLRTLPSSARGNRLLDIGCGAGDFIRYANARGWAAEGVDFAAWSGDQTDIKIEVGDFPSMNMATASFDVITAWAVMEHVRNPSLYFQKIGALLKREGQFIFTVPNVASPGMSHSCDEDTPRHLWLFTPTAVTEYLRRYDMKPQCFINDGSIYRAYPFGLLRRFYFRMIGEDSVSCKMYQNKSVALLQNKPMDVYFRQWLSDVFNKLSLYQITIDGMDLALGLLLGTIAKMTKNYGVITVIAVKMT